MRWTQTLIPTLRNVPKDAEAASHRLALRAGLVRQLSSGVYSYLPLGFRTLHKIIGIVRREMLRAGAEEVLLPALHPAELWKKSGRYAALGDDKIAFKNRAGHEFVLGPTHEEVITELAGGSIRSFRDLPVTLFQIQTKFRDEARPRFGVIRTKEFMMKDAYSFDKDEKGLDLNYRKMAEAYHRIFTACGLTFQVVSADPGMMGGAMSQEFMVECPYGEDRVARSEGGYLASRDIAERGNPEILPAQAKSGSGPEPFDTPNLRTIEEISRQYKIPPSRIVKTLIYRADGKFIAALVTGDSEVNEGKLRKLAGAKEMVQADSRGIQEATGAPAGFAGPVGLRIPIYADWDILGMADFAAGANEKDKHLKNVNVKDFTIAASGDIRYVKDGDPAPDGSGPLRLATTMEIGHIFKLGTRYSESIGATFLDEKGGRRPAIMGCYGIGVNRILAAAIEEHHDEKGIKWPSAIAPFDVELITVNEDDPATKAAAEKIYASLAARGLDVLYDDRPERPGVKFNDADLIGIPKQVIVGERNLREDKVEIKTRATGAAELRPLSALEHLVLID